LGTNKNSIQIKRSWPWWRLILTVLNSLALVLSIIMSWHYLAGGTMIGCGGGSPCELVLGSRWSIIAGIFPISGLAVGVYLALLVASLFIGPTTEAPISSMAWKVILVLAGAIAGSAIWFTILQKWVIGNFCPYCMTTHISGLLLAALVIWRAYKEFGNNLNDIPVTNSIKDQKTSPAAKQHMRPLSGIGLAMIGLALAGLLAVFQVVFTPSSIYQGGESQNKLPGADYHNVPLIGSPDAPYIVSLLFDYQCSHCQKLHFMLDEAVRRYGGKLAFVLCPTPLNNKCNPFVPTDADAFKNSCELAKIGMAVWFARREAFPSFETWMFTFESGDLWRPRSLEAVRNKAVELVGQVKFDAAFRDPWIERYIQNCISIYGQTVQNGKGGVPKLIFDSRWVIPEPYSEDDLVMILQKSLGVPRL
jgi:uncharacterized membrane protein